MANTQLLAVRVLEHVDVGRWERQSALVHLLAAQRGPVIMRVREIEELLARTHDEARYDHRVLLRMVEDRVVLRWPGKGPRPDLWLLNVHVDQWRHVPWITPRRKVVALLFGQQRGLIGQQWGPVAGQSLFLSAPPAPPMQHLDKPTSTFTPPDVHTAAHDVHTAAQQPGETDPPGAHCDPDSVSLSPSIEGSKEPSSSLGRDDDDEGSPGRLRRAVQRAVRARLWGAPSRALDAYEAAHPDHVDRLEAWAATGLSGVKSPKAAVEILLAQAEFLDAPEPAVPSPSLFYRPFEPAEAAGHPADLREELREARKRLGRPSNSVGSDGDGTVEDR